MSLSIMVIDNEQTILQNTVEVLELLGYQAFGTIHAEGSLSLIQQEKPDVVLIDIRMPHINGFDLVRRIRADDSLRHVGVVLMSGTIEGEERRQGHAVGVKHFLEKPFNFEQLNEVVRQAAGLP